jgi:adenylate kinase
MKMDVFSSSTCSQQNIACKDVPIARRQNGGSTASRCAAGPSSATPTATMNLTDLIHTLRGVTLTPGDASSPYEARRDLMAKLVLLTGLPGVGKTTVATSLRKPFYERLHFGGLLRQAVERQTGASLSHSAFREEHHRLVTAAIVRDATLRARELANGSPAGVCVLDSHAVTPTPVGIRAIPDNLELIQSLRFDGIVHLSAEECFDRVVRNSNLDGRQRISMTEAAVAETLQLSVSTLYASAHGCPLMVVPAGGDMDDTIKAVDAAVQAIVTTEP